MTKHTPTPTADHAATPTTKHTTEDLLRLCLKAFNATPNRHLRDAAPGFYDSSALAAAITRHFHTLDEAKGTPKEAETPAPIPFVLEIAAFGMMPLTDTDDADLDPEDMDYVLAETLEQATSWDLQLQLRFPTTGQIEILYEREGLTALEADDLHACLAKAFPHAHKTYWPE